MLATALIVVALILGVVHLAQTHLGSIPGWAIVALAVALLLPLV